MKKFLKIRTQPFLLLISLTVVFLPLSTFAEEEEETMASPPIGVKAVIPDNQIDKTKTYFDLLLEPGEEQQIEIELVNFTAKKITVAVENNDAVTNDNGIVDYSLKLPKDSSLMYAFSELTKIPKEVTIPGNSSVRIPVKIQMPLKKYEGVISGGIYVREKNSPKEAEGANQGLITNKFVYSLGVQLRNEVDISQIIPSLILDEKKIVPVRSKSLNGIEINLQNVSPVFIRELEIEAKIIDNSGKYLVHESKRAGLKMAPNSNFYFPITWLDSEGPAIESGSYVVEINAHSQAFDKKWHWKIIYSVGQNKSVLVKKENTNMTKEKNLLFIIIIICISCVIISIFYVLLKNWTK